VARQNERARSLLAAAGSGAIADLAPERPAAGLSVAQAQMVEIAKALRHEARVLIMDEPTAALSDTETARLFAVIRSLTARGVSVLYISHRMPEIFALGNRVTVMRDGATVQTADIASTTAESLIAAMVGRPLEQRIPKRSVRAGEVVLDVRELQGRAPGPVSFQVRAGEIFGLAGLMGSGRTEVARAIFGADPASGEVRVGGRRLDGSVGDAIAAGVGFLTEDRKGQGLVLDSAAAANITLAVLKTLSGVIDLRGEVSLAERFRDRLRIRLPSVQQPARTLSGGNQQKVILARWLAAGGRVLLLDEPTRGVDVGAKAEIYDELAERGVAILLISSDLTEVLALADRVGVMREGRLAGILERNQSTQERVMALAVG
jgi:ribose transport system ATP-binding protein/rhamnose transport system ATP-binding protein